MGLQQCLAESTILILVMCFYVYVAQTESWLRCMEMNYLEMKKSYIFALSNIVLCLSSKFVFDYKLLVTVKWDCEFSNYG